MKSAKRWLLWKSYSDSEHKKPKKMPFYVSGLPRTDLDTEQDIQNLATYEEAEAALSNSDYKGLGFALGPDGTGNHWQGFDFDNISCNPEEQPTDLRLFLSRQSQPWGLVGYVEVSPSGKGVHIIGYGKAFQTRTQPFESYSGGRFFTFTGKVIASLTGEARPDTLVDLSTFFAAGTMDARARHNTEIVGGAIFADDQTMRDLWSAMEYLAKNVPGYVDDEGTWFKTAFALASACHPWAEDMFVVWSKLSPRWGKEWTDADGESDARKKFARGVKETKTTYKAIFALAQEHGWVNPRSNAAVAVAPAQPEPTPGSVDISGIMQQATEQPHAKKPLDLFKEVRAPVLDFGNTPEILGKFVQAIVDANGFDPSGTLMSAITAIAAALPDQYRLQISSTWSVSPRLWTVLIGRSGAGKTPILKTISKPLKNIHNEISSKYLSEYDAMDKKEQMEHGKPKPPSVFTNDTTVEALSELLEGDSRGILMYSEEMASWIGGIEAGYNKSSAKNRGDWLQLYDGGDRQVNRVSRGCVLIHNWGASILTATTPKGLAKQMTDMPEDGLMQRFLPIVIRNMDDKVRGNCTDWITWWDRYLKHIYYGTARQTITLSVDANYLFDKRKKEIKELREAIEDDSPAFASHLGKHPEMIARIALIFHALEAQETTEVTGATMQKAIDLMEQIFRHSCALYDEILQASPVVELARALARSIVADGHVETVGRNWMTQHCKVFKQMRDERVKKGAVQRLEDLDWLTPDRSSRSYGDWWGQYKVNPEVHRLFAAEGETHRARRERVRSLIADE